MINNDRFDAYDLIGEICGLLRGFSWEQKTIFLREVLKSDLDTQILKLILEMPHHKQSVVLEHLREMTKKNDPEGDRIVEIDVDERGGSRKPCDLLVELSAGETSTKEQVKDLSLGGAFISTVREVHLGEKIDLHFLFPNNGISVTLKGEIVRCTEEGIGVQFLNASSEQRRMIKQILEGERS